MIANLLFVLLAAAPQDFRVENTAPVDHGAWTCPIASPRSVTGDWPAETRAKTKDGRTGRAVLVREDDQTRWWRLRLPWRAGEIVDVWGTGEKVESPEPWHLHPWIGDDVLATAPSIVVDLTDGTRIVVDQPVSLVEERRNAADRRLVLHSRAGGWHLQVAYDYLSGSPRVEIDGSVVWDDTSDPRWSVGVRRLALRVRRPVALDWSSRFYPWPSDTPNETILARDWVAWHSTGIGFRGRVFARPQSAADIAAVAPPRRAVVEAAAGAVPALPEDAAVDAMADSRAAELGATWGVCLRWGESQQWLGAGWIPVRDGGAVAQLRDEEAILAAWHAQLGQPAAPWTPRTTPYSADLFPGRTGSQADFGIAIEVPVRPAILDVLLCQVAGEWNRPGHLFEPDGSPFDASKHPRYVTLNESPHWNPNVSEYRGKSLALWTRSPYGWDGYDPQHYSRHSTAAAALLVDSYGARRLLEHAVETLRSDYFARFPFAGDAPRATGRALMLLADVARVSGTRWRTWAREEIDRRLEWAARGLLPPTASGLGLQTLSVGPPDPRQPFVAVWAPDPKPLLPWRAPWQETIALQGLVAAVPWSSQPDRWGSLTHAVARTLAIGSSWKDAAGRWWIVSSCGWLAGGAPPPWDDARVVASAPNAGDIRSWVLAGDVLAAYVLDVGDPARQQAVDVVIAHTGGREAGDILSARWRASVPSTAAVLVR